MCQRKAALMFLDIINSAELSNALSLAEYDKLITEFQEICLKVGKDEILDAGMSQDQYEIGLAGDGLHIFVYSGRVCNDVEALLRTAFKIKARWLLSKINRERIDTERLPVGLGIGINSGPVIIAQHPGKPGKQSAEGYQINFAKRVEQSSREGKFCRVMLSQSAYQKLSKRPELGLDFYGHEELEKMKGLPEKVRVYEVRSLSFLEPRTIAQEVYRSIPNLPMFEEYARKAFTKSKYDLWIGVCLAAFFFYGGRAAEAANIGEELLSYDERLVGVMKFLGYTYAADFPAGAEKAVMYNEIALETDPYDYMAQFNLAVALGKTTDIPEGKSSGLYSKVVECFRRARLIAEAKGLLGRGWDADWKLPLFLGHHTKDFAYQLKKERLTATFSDNEKFILKQALGEYRQAISVLRGKVWPDELDRERWLTEASDGLAEANEWLGKVRAACRLYKKVIELGRPLCEKLIKVRRARENRWVKQLVTHAEERLKKLREKKSHLLEND